MGSFRRCNPTNCLEAPEVIDIFPAPVVLIKTLLQPVYAAHSLNLRHAIGLSQHLILPPNESAYGI